MPSLARARRASSFSLPPSRQAPRNAAVVEHDFSRVGGPDAHLLELLALRDPRGSLGNDEAGLAPAAQGVIDREDQDMRVGDATVGDPGLGAVEHPLVLRLVVDGARLERGDVRAGVGLRHAECGQLHVVWRAETLRDPLLDLLRRAVGEDPGHGERGTENSQSDAGITPAHLLVDEAHQEPGGVGEALADEIGGVEAVLGGLLNDRPGCLLTLVPLAAGRPDDVLSEVVDPLLDLELVLVQCEGEVRHRKPSLGATRPSVGSPSRLPDSNQGRTPGRRTRPEAAGLSAGRPSRWACPRPSIRWRPARPAMHRPGRSPSRPVRHRARPPDGQCRRRSRRCRL